MPFGLKNAGATYQRMTQTCLEKQIGKTVEAYVDDVVIKTRHVETLIDDLRLTFNNRWKSAFWRPCRKTAGLHHFQ